jgi:hypothetical protein
MKLHPFFITGIFVVISADAFAVTKKPRSQEWRILPKQEWETFRFPKPAEIDPSGFDKRSKVIVRAAEKTHPEIAIASDRIPIEGEIVNARTESSHIFVGEQVFIRGEEQLQVGTTYSITTGPEKVISSRDDRVGFTYPLNGTVKIIGVRDGLFIGTVLSSYNPILRGNLLIPEVKPMEFPKAVASPDIIPASILKVKSSGKTMISDQSVVLLDAGTNDGVKPGMIFRKYLKEDPLTKDTITTKDYLIEAELLIIDAKDQFSTAYVITNRTILHPEDQVLSLMDLRDFGKHAGMQVFIQNDGQGTPLDELDQMDDSQGLGEKENQELRQLEKVDPNQVNTPAVIGNEPSPNDQAEAPVNAAPEVPTAPVDADAPVDAEAPADSAAPVDNVTEPLPEIDPELDSPAEEPSVVTPDASATPDAIETPDISLVPPADVAATPDASLEPPTDATATPDASAMPDASATPSPSPSPSPSPTPTP